MDTPAKRKRNMDINGNSGYGSNSHFIPKYVERRRDERRDERQEEPRFEARDTDALTQPSTQPSCCGIKWGDRYNPTFFNCLAYFGAAACFLLTVNIKVLPDLWYPTIGNLLLPLEITHDNPQRVQVIVVLWGVHFGRRFGEVLFVHIYKRGFTLIEAIGAIVYYCFFGLWIGWSVNIHIGYQTPPNYLYIPGILICFIGGVGNFICHLYLREMSVHRNRSFTSASHHVLPQRGCFQILACPHYSFELITWVGFTLTAFTLASCMFTLATCITLLIYSRKRHLAYQQEFDGKNGRPFYDPKKRKALIPYIF